MAIKKNHDSYEKNFFLTPFLMPPSMPGEYACLVGWFQFGHLNKNGISKRFSCSICINCAQSTWKIDLDLIQAFRTQCCSYIENIAVSTREILSIVTLCN